jgi:hypothetical protein
MSTNITDLLASVKIAPADLKKISEVRERLAGLHRIGSATHRPRQPYGDNWRTELHLAADTAGAKLQEFPTLENAEAYHHAFMRHKESEQTGDMISDLIRPAFARFSAELKDIALKIIDQAEASFTAEARTKGDALRAIDEASAVQHDLRTNSTAAAFASEREHAAADPAGWLQRNGLAAIRVSLRRKSLTTSDLNPIKSE